MLQRAASNAYSWWWASHIRTKQSKWLDNNLQDMEEKVKSMIKLIEEDADSFAKKAEMYYKRRPELINFVQETYKSYRALAERYDHISGELHKANNTIATVFPDQVQFGMEEEEDDSSPKAAAVDSSKFRNGKAPPPTPPVTENKNTKPPAIKTKQKHKRASSQTSKDKAQEEVDKLQKEILVLQTEKEFIKGSYENGLAKYWDIETKITEMQEKVCSLQEEFSADAVIEDDEARALMAVTALKSCEDTLVNLHEQQKKSAEEAKAESQRIKSAREKLRALRKEYGQPQADTMDSSEEVANQNSDVCGLNQERLEVQSVCEKVKKNFQMNSEMSILDLAEKIDELVGKVIALETTVSSQTAQIQRLSLETDELQKNLQTLEEEMSLIDDSKGLSEKVRQAEEELHRIQELDKSVQDDGSKLQTHFTEALHSFNDLSDKLQSPKHQDQVEIADNGDIAHDSQLQSEHKEKEDLEAPDETQGTKEIAMSAREQIVSPETSCIPDNSTNESDKPKEGNEVENSGSSQEDKNSPVNSTHDNGAGKLEEAGKELDARSMDSLQVNGDHQKKSAEHDDLHLVNWQQLFVEGLEDRERILLTEYTCILRNYKDTKRKLAEAEKKNQDDLFETTAQIRDLKNAIAKRDEEIRSLRKKLNFVEASWNENSDVNAAEPKASHSKRLASTGSEEGPPLYTFLSGNFESMLNSELWKGKNVESAVAGDRKPGGGQEGTDSPLGEGNDLQPIERPHALSAIEERFRKDIDELLEENLEFWLRFSSSFQQIHKYQTSVEELQAEIPKLKDRKKQEGSTTSSGEQSVKPEASLTYKQLRDLQTDLEVWLEQNALLKEELQSRFSSLCNIKEEILKVLKDSEEDKEVQFTACQASKFQGEVLNMQQENNKVADELQAGLDHVKGLQAEVEKALVKLNDNFELSGSKNSHHYHFRNFSSKTRVPLRSFLFGAKPKKQSIFSCMNPAFQKQISDLRAGIPP